jgi:hypothetical protein
MRRLSLLVGVLLLCSACSEANSSGSVPAASPAAASGKTIKAVTTMSILADTVKNVGGERVEAENIIPIGVSAGCYVADHRKRNPVPERCRCLPSSCVYCVNIVFGKTSYADMRIGRSMGSSFHPASVRSWSRETCIDGSSRCWCMPDYQQHFGFMTFGIVLQRCS